MSLREPVMKVRAAVMRLNGPIMELSQAGKWLGNEALYKLSESVSMNKWKILEELSELEKAVIHEEES